MRQEGQSQLTELHEDSPDAIRCMISFMYGGDCLRQKDAEILFLVTIYALGDKYDIPLRRVLAGIKFAEELQKFDLSMTSELLEAIKMVYSTTLNSERVLRDAIMQIIRKFKVAFRNDKAFMEVFHSRLGNRKFAEDVLDGWAEFHVPAVAAAPVSADFNYWICSCGRTNVSDFSVPMSDY